MRGFGSVEEFRDGFYHFDANLKVMAHSCLDKEAIKEVWNGFCHTASTLELEITDNYIFVVDEAQVPEIEDYAYAIEVSEDGIAIRANNKQDLIYGFLTLLNYVEPICLEEGKEQFRINCMSIKDKPAIQNRMIHLCVFPETSGEFIQKFIKICGTLKYNYLILEFWGMLQFDCLKELGWRNAFTKEQVREFVWLANELGIEIIPMFNHWGHASCSRVVSGKHVVLDQNPRLAPLFCSYGWVWNIEKDDVRKLMKEIRRELIELCGNGKYFHIGCDEAYGYENMSEHEMDVLIDYLKEITDDLDSCGRRPIMWGDMLLHERHNESSSNQLFGSCTSDIMEQKILSQLDRRIIVGDWQYEAKQCPIETALFIKEQGFDVICCPWDRTDDNIQASIDTVKQYQLFGIMHTTWHTLKRGMPQVFLNATLSWCQKNPHMDSSVKILEMTELQRKISFVNGNYEQAGYVPRQIECL